MSLHPLYHLLFSSSVILSRSELRVLSVRWRWAAVSLYSRLFSCSRSSTFRRSWLSSPPRRCRRSSRSSGGRGVRAETPPADTLVLGRRTLCCWEAEWDILHGWMTNDGWMDDRWWIDRWWVMDGLMDDGWWIMDHGWWMMDGLMDVGWWMMDDG